MLIRAMDHWYEMAYERLLDELHREPTEKELEEMTVFLQEQCAERLYDDME